MVTETTDGYDLHIRIDTAEVLAQTHRDTYYYNTVFYLKES